MTQNSHINCIRLLKWGIEVLKGRICCGRDYITTFMCCVIEKIKVSGSFLHTWIYFMRNKNRLFWFFHKYSSTLDITCICHFHFCLRHVWQFGVLKGKISVQFIPHFWHSSILPYSDHLQLAEDYVTVEVYLQQDID